MKSKLVAYLMSSYYIPALEACSGGTDGGGCPLTVQSQIVSPWGIV